MAETTMVKHPGSLRKNLLATVGIRLYFQAVIAVLLSGLTVACAHKPWDIDSYIQALERPERDEYQKPEEVMTALNVTEGMVVADIGAGSGYFTRRFAQAVGKTGKVLAAVDVEQEMLDYNRKELTKLGIVGNTKFILAKPDDPLLPQNKVDLIFVCNAYHHLDQHTAYFSKTRTALTPSGRVAIVDFYHDERSGKLGFSKHHLVPKERVINEMNQAGFQFLREHTFLPRQYFLEFLPAR